MLALALKRGFMDFKYMINCGQLNSAMRIVAIAAVAAFSLNCFSSEKSLPGLTGEGQIIGKVVGPDGASIPGVKITTSYKGKVLQTTSLGNGAFEFRVDEVERGQGFNMQFVKASFENASAAAVISLPNLQVDVGNVVMYITGGSEVTSRKITGQILDNFAYRPLIGANVSTVDSAGKVVSVVTDDKGKFELVSNYLAQNSTFAVSVFKSDYIPRTDLIAVVTAEENPIRNNPVRVYNKFGAIYGYVADDTQIDITNNKRVSLDGATVVLTNSNNQQITCTSSGAYNALPLQPGEYCPDLTGITTPMTLNIANPTARTNNSGGFKVQDDFLFLGNRYAVSISKTNAACTSRNNGATGCYRTNTTYVDINLIGDNAISGTVSQLKWDAFIHGTVSAGSGVLVKLYDSSNTYIAQATTDGASRFMFDSDKILRAGTYKLTFEKTGYYSRLIGLSAPADPVSITITVAGANNAGAVTMNTLPPPTHCVSGNVTDYWSTQGVSGATVARFDGGWRTATTDINGDFTIDGNFGNTAVNQYPVEISKAGYTGSVLKDKQTFSFTHDGIALPTCSTNPARYNLNAAASSACGATSGGPPAGGTNCTAQLKLYPIGIFADIAGLKRFQNQVKQTYEKFLTEKTGLTISGRASDLVLTSGAQKLNDADTMYIHFDDTPRVLPSVREGKWSNHVPINPLSTVCNVGPNNTPCSPVANGVLAESIGADVRIVPWEIKTYIYYHFYVAQPSSSGNTYTIETTGSTDTVVTVYAQTGALIGSDDDSGSGSNGRVVASLARGWYYAKITGKNDNVFGFFDVKVTGPVQAESNYAAMFSPAVESYQTINGTATYQTNCSPNNGNLVVSWYDSSGHKLYVAAPGENGGCSATATIEKHGPVGEIIRGRFSGTLRPIAAGGLNATISGILPSKGFFNILRQE
jgi:hypothetical protein